MEENNVITFQYADKRVVEWLVNDFLYRLFHKAEKCCKRKCRQI